MSAILFLLLLPFASLGGPPVGASKAEPGAGAGSAAVEDAAGFEALWKEACLWEVGSNAEKVPAARKRLMAAGERTLDFLIPSRLDTKDTLVTRALQVVISGIGKSAVPRLLPCLESEKGEVRRNAADLLGALGAVEAAPAIARLLDDADARLGALAALASLKSESTAPQVARLMESGPPERVRAAAAGTLGTLGGPLAAAALAGQLASPAAAVRFAAQFALEAMKAVDVLRGGLRASDIRVRLHSIAALGHIGDPAARQDLLPLLDDPSPQVRGFAAEAIGQMLAPAAAAVFRSRLTTEKDPFARGKLSAALEPER